MINVRDGGIETASALVRLLVALSAVLEPVAHLGQRQAGLLGQSSLLVGRRVFVALVAVLQRVPRALLETVDRHLAVPDAPRQRMLLSYPVLINRAQSAAPQTFRLVIVGLVPEALQLLVVFLFEFVVFQDVIKCFVVAIGEGNVSLGPANDGAGVFALQVAERVEKSAQLINVPSAAPLDSVLVVVVLVLVGRVGVQLLRVVVFAIVALVVVALFRGQRRGGRVGGRRRRTRQGERRGRARRRSQRAVVELGRRQDRLADALDLFDAVDAHDDWHFASTFGHNLRLNSLRVSRERNKATGLSVLCARQPLFEFIIQFLSPICAPDAQLELAITLEQVHQPVQY